MRRPTRPRGELGEALGDRLGDGVDEVRAHRVAAVDDDVHDDHAIGRRAEHAHLDAARAAAARDEARRPRDRRARGSRPRARAMRAAARGGVGDVVSWIWRS